MILSEYINIKVSNNLIKYYKNLGYDFKLNETLNVKVIDLPKNSGQKIQVKCDFCDNIKYLSLNRYCINTDNYKKKYACSRKCAEVKNKNTIIDKYSTDNISKLDFIKNKKIETCLKNNGVMFPQQSKNIYNKSKITKFIKYDNEFYNNIEKIKNTNIEKYGIDCVLELKEIKEKIKNTCKKNYGFDFYLQSETCKNKRKNNHFNLLINKIPNLLNITNNGYYLINCKEHIFEISPDLFYKRKISNSKICTICNPINKNISGVEIELYDFIKNNYNNKIIRNIKTIITPYELDIYLPDLNLAFEFNGLYWHNELNKPKNYHKIKTDKCLENNIQLIHIYEDDWVYKQDIIKSMILNKLNKTQNKIFARKCEIKEISDNKLCREFLNNNHIQGFVGSKIKIGLFFQNELISLMTFGKLRKSMNSKSIDNEYEMLRFCNKLNTNVIGGASKLFKYFIGKYNPISIISYADRSYSNGNLYKQLGFQLQYITQQNYYYIINNIRNYRFNFRKDILVKQGFDENKTEHEIMLDNKIYRIYNSGNLKFKYLKNKWVK